MVYFGRIQNGKVVLEEAVTLPEGTRVRVEPELAPGEVDPVYRLGEFAVDDGGPPDLAAEHDHYLYGTPKRREGKGKDA